jgi:hypothetical protein
MTETPPRASAYWALRQAVLLSAILLLSCGEQSTGRRVGIDPPVAPKESLPRPAEPVTVPEELLSRERSRRALRTAVFSTEAPSEQELDELENDLNAMNREFIRRLARDTIVDYLRARTAGYRLGAMRLVSRILIRRGSGRDIVWLADRAIVSPSSLPKNVCLSVAALQELQGISISDPKARSELVRLVAEQFAILEARAERGLLSNFKVQWSLRSRLAWNILVLHEPGLVADPEETRFRRVRDALRATK